MANYGIYVAIISALSLILCLSYVKKFTFRSDLSYLGIALSKFILFSVSITFLITDNFKLIPFIHVGVILSLFAHLVSVILYFATNKFRIDIENTTLRAHLGTLSQRYQLIVENALVGLYIFNEKGHIEFVNPALCDIVGYTKEELLLKSIYDLFSPESLELAKDLVEKRFSNEINKATYDAYIIRKDGTKLKVRLCGVRTENGHPTITGSMLQIEG